MRVFATKGFHEASVTDIIEATGVARGTFYLYFPGKREIFEALLDEFLERLRDRLAPVRLPEQGRDDPAVMDQIRRNARQLVSLLLEERDLVRLLLREAGGLDSPARERVATFHRLLGAWVAESLEDGMAAGIVHRGNAALMARALVGMVEGTFRAWADEDLELDLDTAVEELLALLRRGFLSLQA
ncbi:MAG TPA: TetR/AcrR family transcriptional regulator [Myxococcota bacterium]|nr:TetR/AcrR family transcriptional regulator [Myxococcota bacterium]HQK52351.1 TetR/AcrR family transcriptional regulator [Myxococcota bacterium]